MMLTRASSPSVRLAMTLNFASEGSVLAQAQADNYFAGLRLSPASVANLRWNRTTNDVAVPMDKQAFTRQILDAVAPRRIDGTAAVSVGASSAPPTQRAARELRLKLDSLTAERRFGWELSDWGNDDISCGGDGLDATLPQPKHIKRSAFPVHSFTRDGENYNMSPDRTFVKFDLSRPGQWPRSYIANVFIAERDASGGFIEFLQKLWEAIGPQVISLTTTLILGALGYAAGTGAAAGAAAGSVAPLVGTILGAIVGAILGLLVAWLLDSLRDDIFESPDNPLAVILPDPTALFENNSLKSPKYIADFERGAARYLLRYYWELSY